MDTKENEEKLSYLLSGTLNVLPSSYLKLRSYLSVHSSSLADVHGLKLPKCFTNRTATCPYCYIPWSSDTSSFKLLPVKKFKSHHTQTKKKKKETLKINEEAPSNNSKNKLVLKCKFCSQTSLFSLFKPKHAEDKIKEAKVVTKHKKKKKDKSCGLLVNLNKSTDNQSSNGVKINKVTKEKRTDSTNQLKCQKSVRSQKSQSAVPLPRKPLQAPPSDSVNKVIPKPCTNKKVVVNPHAVQTQRQNSKNKKKNLKKLKKLQRAVKECKGEAKKTLKDFLTLVSK